MSTFKYLPQYFSTTLNVGGGIDASQTTGIVLLSVSGVDITKPGQICISYSDPLDTGVAEWINYTSINGSNELVGVTRGCEGYSAHTHLPSAVIQFTLSATHINDLADVVNGIKAKDLVTTAGGTTTYTLTPTPAVGAYVTGQEFNIKMNATNTGASTINVSGLGAKSLTKGGATALASGDLLINATYTIIYDGTQFQVLGGSFGGAWTTFTPSWTNLTVGTGGGATNTGAYTQIGKTVIFHVDVKLGTSGPSVGTSPQLTLPVAINAPLTQFNQIGQCTFITAATTIWPGWMDGYGILRTSTISTYPTLANVTATQPFTWAAGCIISVYGTYEAA